MHLLTYVGTHYIPDRHVLKSVKCYITVTLLVSPQQCFKAAITTLSLSP